MVPSPHIVATYVVIHTHTYCTFHHVDTEIHILIPCPASSRMNSCMTCCWFLFCCILGFFFLLWCTCEHLSSVSIWTQLLGCLTFELFFLFVFALLWGRSELSGVFIFYLIFLFCCVFVCFFFGLFYFSGVLLHHPPSILQARIKPLLPFFASSCAAWTFGGWKFQSSPPHQVCVYFVFLP